MLRTECPYDHDCDACLEAGGPYLCRCLGITEEEVVSSLVTLELRSVRSVREATGAGTGCNGCHRKIQVLIETYSSSSLEICSAR